MKLISSTYFLKEISWINHVSLFPIYQQSLICDPLYSV
jgi:hypothetical protein